MAKETTRSKTLEVCSRTIHQKGFNNKVSAPHKNQGITALDAILCQVLSILVEQQSFCVDEVRLL